MAVAIGNLGTIPSLTVNGRVFTDLTTLIVLYGNVVTAGRFTTLRLPSGTAGYQVTAGKTYTVHAHIASNASGTGSGQAAVLYGDTDVGLDSAAAPTTPKYIAGDSAIKTMQYAQGANTFGQPLQNLALPVNFAIPAAKYGCVTSSGAAVTHATYGYET